MSTTQPIRDAQALQKFKNYYLQISPSPRNYALCIIGLNTALRISDILALRWSDVLNFQTGKFEKHLTLTEQKTGKYSRIALNLSVQNTLSHLLNSRSAWPHPEDFLFPSAKGSNQPLSRYQAYRLIKTAAAACGLEEPISCHSLRKTFGYYAWKQGTPPAMLMNIYNHSSFQITKRYLGIEQDDRDRVFLNIDI